MTKKDETSGKAKKSDKHTQADSKKVSPTPEQLLQIGNLRDTLLRRFGQVVLMFCGVSRYAHQPISELQRLCIAPMMRDRIAIAMGGNPKAEDGAEALASPMLGIAIWANVSEDVDIGIREQIREGVFPVKMKVQDWDSGDIIWLLDVVAPSRQISEKVLANFRSVLKAQKIDLPNGQIRLHPVIKRTLGEDVLKTMGAMTLNEAKAHDSAVEELKGESVH